MKFQTNNYHSIRLINNNIHIGSLPPNAKIIKNPPENTDKILSYFSNPTTIKDAIMFLRKKHDISESELDMLINQLIESKIIVPERTWKHNRYARHNLYFDMLGIDASKSQKILKNKKVGLVGMGGIGTNIAMNLVGAGIGTLVISDGDKIEESNLTRQFLYNEKQIGEYKVDSAIENLKKLNSTVQVFSVKKQAYGKEFFDQYFKDCDFVLLSADSPFQIHEWINDSAVENGFAYSNAGYIEGYGVVGPLVNPGVTACYNCYKDTGDLYEFSNSENELEKEINSNYQAASYGPLNSLVASMQSNEIIRYLLNMETKTSSTRLLINSENYKIYEEHFDIDPLCTKCGELHKVKAEQPKDSKKIKDNDLSDIYLEERENKSFNSMLLDPILPKYIKIIDNERILDIGAATGENSIFFAKQGAMVDSLDISESMTNILSKKLKEEKLSNKVNIINENIESVDILKKYDYIICNNIIDYIDNIDNILLKLKSSLKDTGKLILTIPHPFKDSGFWEKEYYNQQWNYNKFIIDDYFYEGEQKKSRENAKGETVIKELSTYKRTTETYINKIINAGFEIIEVIAPKPKEIQKKDNEILYKKSSKVPYFQMFILKNRGMYYYE
ncbi:ThiF family adenylyltransferase [Staphylococcus chromogenes]|uniref:ThiF family adenylyltransferase n=1 Tax=Staphylococcus chromogenes TaxID=46126 RepID=UPI001C3CEE93|nr:ThiF family adenylyltransferase [Staphylococcus chromogenes]MBV5192299.1 ThiF family adenylyltransferase [Staphylococcus chromogenes]MBW3133396.1 ThiF family adenylyltransferase [Staphylococcus chromogenes]